MRKLLLSIIAITAFTFANAQCTELFFSEYVEGSNNNKALEIYNPTADTIDLSDYRIVRYSNGSTTSNSDIRYVQPLSGSIPPYKTYVAVGDKRDPSGTGNDTILFPDLLNFANSCNAGFYSPDYNSGTQGARVLFHNGDDAISLEKDDGAGNFNIVDLFGVIGEQPLNGSGTTTPNGGWTSIPDHWDGVGDYWSKDHTLVRKSTVTSGVAGNPGVAYSSPGAFNPSIEWDSLPENTFDSLGFHNCSCNPAPITIFCNPLLSIAERFSKIRVKVFPNPLANTLLSIDTDERISFIEVYNLIGIKIYSFTPAFKQEVYTISLSSEARGVHFLKITFDGGKVAVEKLLLQ